MKERNENTHLGGDEKGDDVKNVISQQKNQEEGIGLGLVNLCVVCIIESNNNNTSGRRRRRRMKLRKGRDGQVIVISSKWE